ncbi:MAG: glycoside hydrolase family 97 N-terminal domain-containing protein [Candidatus Nealsonbacteria bacterium]|nr:glycoside hydrolase family 97 N-terminal domain-containing protein [Candidatus Nealsonbacteria bacterium]
MNRTQAQRWGLLLLSVALLSVADNAKAAEKSNAPVEVTSPGEKLRMTLTIADRAGSTGCPVYRVLCGKRVVIAPSGLGLELADGTLLTEGFQRLAVIERGQNDSTWKTVCGERSVVRDRYRSAIVEMIPRDKSHDTLRLEIRVYDEAVAFRYLLPAVPGKDMTEIAAEKTRFQFTADHDAWAVYSAQGVYRQVKLSQIKGGCERPLTIRVSEVCRPGVDDNLYVAVAEAALVDYARMKLAPSGDAPLELVSNLHGPVALKRPLRTPWRVIMVAGSPGELLENNDVLRNLNDPCAIDDTSWIRPGKVIREVSLSTAGGKRCVDFAVKYGLQFIEYDAGWYGPEGDAASDATTVTLDPKRSKGPLDLPEVIRYARQHGIGVIVYVNRRAAERQLGEILPLYRRWGIAGVKYGFVNVGSQEWTSWLHEAIRAAARNRLMIDVHDEYRPTGWERTYPNFMTSEGIAGDETAPSNQQTLTILFTRMLAGPGDNTVCYFDGRVDRNASHAYQLAKPVCIFSPWQFLFWYDRPEQMHDEPELEFYKHLPTVWDETKVLHARIGQYAVIARRHGHEWFVGCMNAGQPRTLDVPLDFLPAGRRFDAHIYRDDPTVDTRTKVRVTRQPVEAGSVLQAAMTAQGGMAVRLVPK